MTKKRKDPVIDVLKKISHENLKAFRQRSTAANNYFSQQREKVFERHTDARRLTGRTRSTMLLVARFFNDGCNSIGYLIFPR